MTAEQLRKAAQEVFGKAWGWKTRLAEGLLSDPSAVGRWLSGTIPVPGPVEVAMRLLLAQHRETAKKAK